MKTYTSILAVLMTFMTACGGGGGSGDATDPINPPPQCKGIFSKWKSPTTMEEHDFRSLVLGVEHRYNYFTTNGYYCGSSNNLMTIKINEFQPQDLAYQDGFTGYAQFDYKGSNDCPNDYHSGGNNNFAVWKIECDVLTMCAYDVNGGFNCRTFN